MTCGHHQAECEEGSDVDRRSRSRNAAEVAGISGLAPAAPAVPRSTIRDCGSSSGSPAPSQITPRCLDRRSGTVGRVPTALATPPSTPAVPRSTIRDCGDPAKAQLNTFVAPAVPRSTIRDCGGGDRPEARPGDAPRGASIDDQGLWGSGPDARGASINDQDCGFVPYAEMCATLTPAVPRSTIRDCGCAGRRDARSRWPPRCLDRRSGTVGRACEPVPWTPSSSRREAPVSTLRPRNPVHRLPSWAELQSLPPEAWDGLRRVLLDLRSEANELAETAWRRRKGPMAAYWRAVSTYARHLAGCCVPPRGSSPGPDSPATPKGTVAKRDRLSFARPVRSNPLPGPETR